MKEAELRHWAVKNGLLKKGESMLDKITRKELIETIYRMFGGTVYDEYRVFSDTDMKNEVGKYKITKVVKE